MVSSSPSLQFCVSFSHPSPSCFRSQNFFAKPCYDVTPLTAQSSRVLHCACAIECVTLWTERTRNTAELNIVARLYTAHANMHATYTRPDKILLKSGPIVEFGFSTKEVKATSTLTMFIEILDNYDMSSVSMTLLHAVLP